MLSVIIPVKNMEIYIRKCLNSVLQSKIVTEIIVVDFGSGDKTLDYVTQFFDKRIKIMMDIDGNAATARNLGLKEAKGKYISFIDADDWIEENFYENSVLMMEERNADIINCGFRNVDVNSKECETYLSNNLTDIQINDDNLNEMMYNIGKGYYNLEVWNKIYRRAFLIKNKIVFNDINGVNGEDVYFNLISILYKPYIITLNVIVYNHLIRTGSLSKKNKDTITIRFITIMNDVYEFIKKNNYDFCLDGYSEVVFSMFIQDLVNYMINYSDVKQRMVLYRSNHSFLHCAKLIRKSSISKRSRRVLSCCVLHKLTIVIYIIKLLK